MSVQISKKNKMNELDEKLKIDYVKKFKNCFKEEHLEELYLSELKNITKLINDQSEIFYKAYGREMTSKEKESLRKNMTYKDIEKFLPNTIKYLNDSVSCI